MATTTRAAVLVEHGQPLAVEEIILQDPQGPEVLVEYFATGICHSQLHQMVHPAVKTPSLLGHEGTGVVLKVGGDVTHIKEGDHCIVTWVPRDIKVDSPALPMTSYEYRGEKRRAGVNTWSEHALINEQLVVPLSNQVETAATAIVGCATVTGVGAVLGSAKVQKGQSVAVIGVGGVGINVIAGAKIAGADPIIAVDLADDKLDFAKEFGATHTVNASETDAVEAIHEITGGGADFAFDAIGGPVTTSQILAAVKSGRIGAARGGTAVVVGASMVEPFQLPPESFPSGEKHLIGSIGGSSHPAVDYPQYIDWYRSGKLPLDKMVTTVYSGIDEINEAVRALKNGEIRGRSIMVYK